MIAPNRIGTAMRKNSPTSAKLGESGTLSGQDDLQRNAPMTTERACDFIMDAADARVGKAYSDGWSHFSAYTRPIFPMFYDAGLAKKTRL